MNGMNATGVVAGPGSGQTSHTQRLRRLAATGFIAALAAMVAATLAAALAHAVGVDFEVPDGGERILARSLRTTTTSATPSSHVDSALTSSRPRRSAGRTRR